MMFFQERVVRGRHLLATEQVVVSGVEVSATMRQTQAVKLSLQRSNLW